MGQKTRTPLALLTLSLMGVLLAIGFLTKPRTPTTTEYDLLVWVIFSALCIMGATATFFPHHCSVSINLPEDLHTSKFTIIRGRQFVHGHHPTCEKFKCHEFILGGKTFCASCIGLLIGAVSAFIVATVNFVYNYSFSPVVGYIGLGCIILGLLYIPLLRPRTPVLRSAYNALFVLGFALLLVTVDGIGDLGFDLVVIGLCVFWMFTRIQLSRWSYDIMCGSCDEICERKVL